MAGGTISATSTYSSSQENLQYLEEYSDYSFLCLTCYDSRMISCYIDIICPKDYDSLTVELAKIHDDAALPNVQVLPKPKCLSSLSILPNLGLLKIEAENC